MITVQVYYTLCSEYALFPFRLIEVNSWMSLEITGGYWRLLEFTAHYCRLLDGGEGLVQGMS